MNEKAPTPLMTNSELADAIAAAIGFARSVQANSLAEAALFAHIKQLLEAQAKRASAAYYEAIGE